MDSGAMAMIFVDGETPERVAAEDGEAGNADYIAGLVRPRHDSMLTQGDSDERTELQAARRLMSLAIVRAMRPEDVAGMLARVQAIAQRGMDSTHGGRRLKAAGIALKLAKLIAQVALEREAAASASVQVDHLHLTVDQAERRAAVLDQLAADKAAGEGSA